MKRHLVLLRLRNSAHDEIRELEAACAEQPIPDAENGRSSEELTVVFAVQLKDLRAVVAQLELELVKRDLLRTLH
jgi:hypothetical protein